MIAARAAAVIGGAGLALAGLAAAALAGCRPKPTCGPADATPSFSVTNAAIAWPLISCARPTTAASATLG